MSIVVPSPSQFVQEMHALLPVGWLCIQENCDGVHHFCVKDES